MPRSQGPTFVALHPALLAVSVMLAFMCSARLDARNPHREQNSSTLQSGKKQSPEQVIKLETGKAITIELGRGVKQVYSFELGKDQYASIAVDCPSLSVSALLFDSSGEAIDRTYGTDPSTKNKIDLATDEPGSYRLEIKNTAATDGGILCTIMLADPRHASDKDFLLQQARALIFRSAKLINDGRGTDSMDQLQKAIDIRERLLGPEDPLLVFPIYLLGNVYLHKSDYPKAEAFYGRALKLQEKIDPVSTLTYAVLNNEAQIYLETDRFDLAEQFLLRAIAIAEKIYGQGSTAAVNPIVNLASLYDEKGDYTKAQAMYEKAWADGAKHLGPDYPGLAVIISNLAGVYSERGDYAGAARLAQQAVAIADKPGRKEDQRLALSLVALADAYRFQNDLDRAEPLYARSLNIYQQVAGADDPLVADNLSYLADIYQHRRDFAKSEEFYRKALKIREKTLGEDTTAVAKSLDNLGTLSMMRSDYAHAGPLFRQALAIREKAFGPDHPDVAETLTKLSAFDMATGIPAEAETLLARAIGITERNARLNLAYGSERQKLAYLELSSSQLDQAITLSADLAPDNERARDLAVTTLLQRKGRVQDALADNLKSLRQRLDPDGIKLLDQFDDATSHLARLVISRPEQMNAEEYQKRISQLKDRREQLEAEISVRSAQFRAASQPVTLESIRAALSAGSALIEFVNYEKLVPGSAGEKRPGESRYVAYVIPSSGPVRWKQLGPAAELDRSIDAFRQALRDPDRHDIRQLARQLDAKLLEPIRPLLGEATHLLISPDGELSLMPFEALLDQQNHYTIERYSVTYLSTGRDLLRMQAAAVPSNSNPLIVADPVFGEPGTTQIAAVHYPNGKIRRRSITTAADLSSVYFAPLTGTAQEARSIHSLFPDARVLTGPRASVAALKQVEAPSILHIATHGFFLEDHPLTPAADKAAAPARGVEANLDIDNPLLRSGLAFAGANINRGRQNSGILTALEAADLNLWGTKLVTLSACDTGVGEVRDREGVYGLRRAFTLAGAETLVMSLWPVSDQVTREMMTAYYTGLKHGLGRGEALRQAELSMLKRKGREHPFYWASFIQSGEWANLDGQR